MLTLETFFALTHCRTSFFLVGFWTTAMVVALIILGVGVRNAILPPASHVSILGQSHKLEGTEQRVWTLQNRNYLM